MRTLAKVENSLVYAVGERQTPTAACFFMGTSAMAEKAEYLQRRKHQPRRAFFVVTPAMAETQTEALLHTMFIKA